MDAHPAEISVRRAPCEKALTEHLSGRSDVTQKLVSRGIDLLKMTVIGIVGAALWAFANGYQGGAIASKKVPPWPQCQGGRRYPVYRWVMCVVLYISIGCLAVKT